MKNVIYFFVGLSLMSIACKTDDSKKFAKLEYENDSLRKIIEKFRGHNIAYNTLEEAQRATSLFRNHPAGSDIVIPVSWRFLKSDFINLLDDGTEFMKFYPCFNDTIAGDTMRLAMVPVNKKGDDMIGVDGNTKVYNFSQNCPAACSSPNVLNTDAKSNLQSKPVRFTRK